MKFGESIPSAAQARADARATFRFTLEQGARAGQSFAVTLHVCPNPVCPCAHVGFECRPLPALGAAEAGGPASPASLRFDLIGSCMPRQQPTWTAVSGIRAGHLP